MKGFKQYIKEAPENDTAVQWVKSGDNRAAMTAIAKKSVGTDAHPGILKVFRGVRDDSVDAGEVGSSWTKDKKVAQKYAGDDGKVISTVVTTKTPAVDLSKLLPKSLAKDKEVFVKRLGK